MNSKNIKMGEFYRLKSSPNYGYIKPIRISYPKTIENDKNYILVECEHMIYKNSPTSIIRKFCLAQIVRDMS